MGGLGLAQKGRGRGGEKEAAPARKEKSPPSEALGRFWLRRRQMPGMAVPPRAPPGGPRQYRVSSPALATRRTPPAPPQASLPAPEDGGRPSLAKQPSNNRGAFPSLGSLGGQTARTDRFRFHPLAFVRRFIGTQPEEVYCRKPHLTQEGWWPARKVCGRFLGRPGR